MDVIESFHEGSIESTAFEMSAPKILQDGYHCLLLGFLRYVL